MMQLRNNLVSATHSQLH